MSKGYVTGLRMSIFQISRNTRCGQRRSVPQVPRQVPTRGGKSEMVECKLRSRIVVVEFPSFEAALAC